MNQYRTEGVLDEAALLEINRHFLPCQTLWAARIAAGSFAVFALLSLIAKNGFYTVVFALFAAFFALVPRYYTKKFTARSLALLKENSPDGTRRMESFFVSDGMMIRNRDTGGEICLLYPIFSRAVETEHYFFLITHAGQYCLVFKDCLTSEQNRSFLPFLKEKCPQLKVAE